MVSRKFQPSKYYLENGSNTLYTLVNANLNVMKAQHKNTYSAMVVKNTLCYRNEK